MWLTKVSEELGTDVTQDQLKDFLWKTLNSGQVVPGYGHAVLRKTDPRYACQREFALKHLPNDAMFKMVSLLYEVSNLTCGVQCVTTQSSTPGSP